MKVKILTLDGTKFDDFANYVKINLPDGQLGIMNGFEECHMVLKSGVIKIDSFDFLTSSGHVEITRDIFKKTIVNIIVLTAKIK